MLALLRAFLKIIMRQLGPEDLPDSRLLMLIALSAYIGAQIVPAMQVYGVTTAAAAAIGLDVLMLVVAVWIILRVAGHSDRRRQTLTALLGTSALLTLPLVPLNLWLQAFTQAGHAPAGPSVAILLLITWSLTVQGHILARALSTQFVIGLLVAIGYFIVNYGVIFELLPARP